MPYSKNEELPSSIQDHLPKHAQDIYREAFNNAFEQYNNPHKRRNTKESREEVAHKTAWAAVKKAYHKNENGNWVKN